MHPQLLHIKEFVLATVWRWARALKHCAEKSPLTISPDEMTVGRPAVWLGGYAIVHLQLDVSVMPLAVEVFRRAKCKPNEVVITAEDEKTIRATMHYFVRSPLERQRAGVVPVQRRNARVSALASA